MLRLFLLLALLVFLLLYWSAAAQTVVSLSSSGEVEQQQRRTKRRLLALAHHHDVILAIPTGKEGGGCGGVLIAPDVILAVTNCEAEWLNADGARILQSHHHRHHRATATAESTKTIRQVNFMFKHPQYDPSLSRTRHNLMLIQLTEPVVLLEEAGLVSYYYDEFADNAVTENEIMKLPLKPSSSDDHNEGTTSPALYLLLADSTEGDDEDPVVFARLVETIEPGENEPEVGEKAPQQNRETQQTEQVGNYDNQQQHMFCTKVVTKESGYFQGGVHGGGWPIVTATSTIAKIAEDSEVDHRQIQHHSTSRHRLVGLVSRWNNPPEDAEATTATTAHCVTDSVHIAAYSNWIRETLCCVSAHLADNKECHDFKQRQQNGNDVSCSATIMQQREQQRRRRLQEDTSQPSASPVEGNTLNPSTERTATPLASSVAEQPSATPVNTELTSAFPLPGAGNEPTSSPAPNGGTNNVPTANPNNFTADGPSFNPVGGGATSVPVPPPTRPPFLGGFFPESPTVHPAGQTASPTENASTLSPSASPVQGAPPTAAPRDPPTRPPFSGGIFPVPEPSQAPSLSPGSTSSPVDTTTSGPTTDQPIDGSSPTGQQQQEPSSSPTPTAEFGTPEPTALGTTMAPAPPQPVPSAPFRPPFFDGAFKPALTAAPTFSAAPSTPDSNTALPISTPETPAPTSTPTDFGETFQPSFSPSPTTPTFQWTLPSKECDASLACKWFTVFPGYQLYLEKNGNCIEKCQWVNRVNVDKLVGWRCGFCP